MVSVSDERSVTGRIGARKDRILGWHNHYLSLKASHMAACNPRLKATFQEDHSCVREPNCIESRGESNNPVSLRLRRVILTPMGQFHCARAVVFEIDVYGIVHDHFHLSTNKSGRAESRLRHSTARGGKRIQPVSKVCALSELGGAEHGRDKGSRGGVEAGRKSLHITRTPMAAMDCA